jgi:CBS domain-containing protein
MSAAPVCMAASESVSAAARAMKERGIGTVLILSGGQLSGLVTDRDITIRVLAENRDPRTTRLGDICGGELAVLSPDDDVETATRIVRDRAVRRLPVIADGTPVGVVSIGDLAMGQDQRSAPSEIPASRPDR